MTQATAFPKGFIWGAAAASYQIEGSHDADGKGPSIWDEFSKKPGAVWRGHNGDVACDHYRRMPEDVALMAELGLSGYRFSVSWARVLPEGVGKVNEKGLDFYDRLVDALLAAKIEPLCTLFHWDYPAALNARGGWLSRDSVAWFDEYAGVMAARLGDRMKHWLTLNEPNIYTTLGYQAGIHAPGDKRPSKEVLQIAHHQLLAHGHAVRSIRKHCKDAEIGFAPQTPIAYPSVENEADIAAARAFTFDTEAYGRVFNQRLGLPIKSVMGISWWLDPVFLGKYPETGLAFFGDDAPSVQAGDMQTIAEPIDFCGANIYLGIEVKAGAGGMPTPIPPTPATPITGYDWPVTPTALYWGPKLLYERYGKAIHITENGLALRDWVALDGAVHDPQRIDFTTRYLRELARAMRDGVDVRGYYHWSILDNFEWGDGYKQRFGLVHVDYGTQKRTPKDSAYWYRDVAKSNGAGL